MEGQLWPAERKLLHSTIISAVPNVVLEVGTWMGGGSTLQIVEALLINKNGHLHTCELDTNLFNIAKSSYEHERPDLLPHITIHNKSSSQLISELINSNMIPDVLFFDGPEDPSVAINDLKTLEPLLKSGTVFMMHDWDPGPSTKAHLIRPYIEANWIIKHRLTAPESVGFVVAIKR